MVFPQVIAAFQAVFNIIALPGNLLVIATVILESSRWLYVKRYILLASLALSDRLILILVFDSHSASELQRKKPWLLTHVTQVTSLDWVIVLLVYHSVTGCWTYYVIRTAINTQCSQFELHTHSRLVVKNIKRK